MVCTSPSYLSLFLRYLDLFGMLKRFYMTCTVNLAYRKIIDIFDIIKLKSFKILHVKEFRYDTGHNIKNAMFTLSSQSISV